MKLARVAVALMVVFALQLLSFRPAVGLASAKRPDTQAGDLDLSFGGTGTIMTQVSTATDSAAAVAMQEDGKIVVAGTGADANSEFVIARYNPDGTLDSTFHTDGIVVTRIGTTDVATDVAIQPDGRIVVGGFTYIGGHADLAIARYTSTGELDTTFGGGDGVVTTTIGANSDDTIQAIELQPDGRIVVAGSRWATDTDFVVARYKLDGSLDPTFSGDGHRANLLEPDL